MGYDAMKKAVELERVAVKEILKLRRDGGSREDAFAAAEILFHLKQRLDEARAKATPKGMIAREHD